jgi:hypothetical protein
MATSRRRDIRNYIKDKLAAIDGGISTYLSSYMYTSNLSGNAYNGIKFLDEIDDFPSLYIQADNEFRIYDSYNLTHAELPLVIRFYIQDEDSITAVNNLAQDIEHVLYNLSSTPTNLGILDITITEISTDEGMLSPLGLGEIFIEVSYQLEQ